MTFETKVESSKEYKERLDRFRETCNIALDAKEKINKILRNKLDRKDKDIETLKAEINRQNNIIVDYMNTNASLRELAAEQKRVIKQQTKVIRAMAEHINEQGINKNICKPDSTCEITPCTECIIEYFKEEQK